MESKINELIENTLFKLTGKLTLPQFRNIVKKMGWKMNYKKMHIVGTNGKGSVSKYLNDNLVKDMNRVGLFTSPHILSFEERIKVNNENIPFLDLQEHIIDIYIKFPKYSFGFFQLMFLACLAYFERKKINIAIFESGIGAKKDIVNYLDFDITIFTSISIDHEKILGTKIEKISEDKSFAIKEKNQVFYPNTINKVSEKILKDRAKTMQNKSLNMVKIKSKNIHEQNQELSKHILKKEFDIEARLFNLPIGRAQEIKINNIDCYIDVGHNEEAIQKTLNYFQESNIEFDYYIVSLSSDKDVKKIMKNFDPKNTLVYKNRSDRALSHFDYPQEFGKVYSLQNFIKTLDKKILFIGSFYFIEEILRLVKYDINSKI